MNWECLYNQYSKKGVDNIYSFAFCPVQKGQALADIPPCSCAPLDLIDKILMDSQDIVELAKLGAYFDDSIEFVHREDIASASVAGNTIVLNYNMNPYEKQSIVYPNFVSVVMRYVDGLDIGRYLDFNENAEFYFTVINFTNSLKRIFVEFKYSDNIRIL